jgi:hypothetical protein
MMHKFLSGTAVVVMTVSVLALIAAYDSARPENAPPQTRPQSADTPEPATPPPAPAQPAAPAPAPPAPLPPAAATVLPSHEVQAVLGREVLSSTGEDMGRIVDVLVDLSGEVRAAIIDFGGFLGVGSRKIAVEWNALHFPPPAQTDAKITLELTRDQVKAAPEYQDGKPVVVLGALGKLEPLPFQ